MCLAFAVVSVGRAVATADGVEHVGTDLRARDARPFEIGRRAAARGQLAERAVVTGSAGDAAATLFLAFCWRVGKRTAMRHARPEVAHPVVVAGRAVERTGSREHPGAVAIADLLALDDAPTVVPLLGSGSPALAVVFVRDEIAAADRSMDFGARVRDVDTGASRVGGVAEASRTLAKLPVVARSAGG